MLFKHYIDLDEVSDELKQRMQDIIDADREKVATVIGKVQKA